MTFFAVLENGRVREIVETDAPGSHPQRANFRAISQEGDPKRFIGLPAVDLPVGPSLAPIPPAPPALPKVDRIFTEDKTVRLKRDPDPPPHHGRPSKK